MFKWKLAARTGLDLVIFGLVCCAEYAVHRWFEPVRRGFFCGDETLQYPLRPSTVSLTTLLAIVLAVPPAVVLAVELFKRLSRPSSAASTSSLQLRRRLVACYKHIGCYLFGLGLTLVATEVGKRAVGRLRPHFFAVCQPQLDDGSTCADAKNHGLYIEAYTCRAANGDAASNVTQAVLKQVAMSFPSGHASIFFYAMLYVALYLQAALTTRASRLLKHLLQFVFVLVAWFVALSRVADYWHHWSDVLAGGLLGSLCAVVTAVCVADLFRGSAVGSTQRRRGGGCGGGATELTKPHKAATATPTPVLPSYTFGSMQYLHGQPYHNYGYVP